MSIKYKYRPSLTKEDIKHILYLAKCSLSPTSSPSTPEGCLERKDSLSRSVIKSLAPFLAKIENDIISPAYVSDTSPKPSLLESLEGITPPLTPTLTGEAKRAYGKTCYNKMISNIETCNLQEIAAAREHAYVNDFMSPEEEAEYEAEGTQGVVL